jgi:hypothetical protein
MQTRTHELMLREADGLEVALVWRREVDRLTVVVNDERLGASFEIDAPRDRALDAFHHPFAYAAAQGLMYSFASR